MAKVVIFLADGMADEPLEELGGKTPLEAVDTPYMDLIAEKGASGTFLSLPEGFPTSSDVANMSVLGYDLNKCYPGRGPLEAVSKDIELEENDIAWRCNLVTVKDGILEDYSAGHIEDSLSKQIMNDLQKEFGTDKISFHHGVSYRNLIVLHGNEFSADVSYFKPDSNQGGKIADNRLFPMNNCKEPIQTVEFLNEIIDKSQDFLKEHPLNQNSSSPANYIWPWSPGKKPKFIPFSEKYNGKTGAVISAVDVIFGIAKCAEIEGFHVLGASGFIDTNYEGKARAAIEALDKFDFVYLHVEATDESSHIGDLEMKMKAIKNFDDRIIKPVFEARDKQETVFAILPDHPVPIKLRKHTRTPVPVAVCGPHIKPDPISVYSESEAPKGSLGNMKGDELMRLLLEIT